MLPRLGVEGEAPPIQESAYGPVEGYIAKRSATATKTDTPIIETPQSISVISRKDMDVRNVRDTGDAVAYTAGILGGTAGEKNIFGGSSIKIRGYGGHSAAGEPASGNTYLDGLKQLAYGYLGNNLDPWLFERVEVFKGPSSVLFGQAQPGGIVNRVTKRPHGEMYNQVRLGSGNFDSASLAFDLGAELNDAWQFRIVGLGLDGKTQQVYGKRKRQLIAPSLRWTNGASDLTVFMHYQRDNMNAGFYNHAPRAALFGNPNGRIPMSFRAGDPSWDLWDIETKSIGYLFSHDFNDALTFRQNLRYTNGNLHARRSWHNLPLSSDQRLLTRFNFQERTNIYDITIDNQLQWKLTMDTVKHTFLIGIDHQRPSGNYINVFGSVPPLDLFAPIYNQNFPAPNSLPLLEKTRFRQTGVYIQDQINIGNLSLLIGGRYDKAQLSDRDNNRTAMFTIRKISDNAFTSRVGAIYNFNNSFAPYFSYAESFEPISGGRTFDGSPLEPMEGKQYELGFKYQPAGTEYLITIAAFDLTQKNMSVPDINNPRFSIQIGEIQTRGIELEGKFSVNDNLHVTSSYTYLNDEIIKSNRGDEGNPRPQIPRHSASLWANYSLTRGILAGMGIGIGARYTGRTLGDTLNPFTVPSYTLVDLAAYWDLEQSPLGLQGWQASLNVNNLLNKYYVASCFRERFCYLGRERSIRFSVGYEWDW